MEKHYLSVLVANHAGVLARISSLFCQRGFNIDSLTVSATDNPEISRITIVTTGDEASFRQVRKQTEKLIETKALFPLNLRTSLLRELLLIKLRSNQETRQKIEEIAKKIIEGVRTWAFVGAEKAMTSLNVKPKKDTNK